MNKENNAGNSQSELNNGEQPQSNKKEPRKKLPVTKKLLNKLRGIKEKDPNIYPMW